MLFNSIDFAIFLPIVFIIYWFVVNKNLKLQNVFIVAASYLFYGWWDWRFLFLILLSTTVDYLVGIGLSKQEDERKRKVLLWITISANLGLLAFFKYFNFFQDNFIAVFTLFGKEFNATSLKIILPVGISFYTFQTLSYTIDVYKRKLEACQDFISFMAFVSFFPQLVAGPIERATHLLPQFYVKRTFDYAKAVDGMRQILWGLFKKIVIADSCAEIANEIFNHSSDYSGSTLVLGAVFFTIQIYGDFSGYSDIAIGTSKLFGFDLMQNFSFPYFSRDIAEFWRRWHISLSTWFRDYVYIPLGGSHGGTWKKVRNTFIIFILSGFWHGANWTFIAWGALNALYFLPILLMNSNRQHLDIVAQDRMWPSFKELMQMTLTFGLTTFAWIFFRAESITHAKQYIVGIFSKSLFAMPHFPEMRSYMPVFIFVVLFMLIEWFGRKNQYAIKTSILYHSTISRRLVYISLVLVIYYFSVNTNTNQFIYFQF